MTYDKNAKQNKQFKPAILVGFAIGGKSTGQKGGFMKQNIKFFKLDGAKTYLKDFNRTDKTFTTTEDITEAKVYEDYDTALDDWCELVFCKQYKQCKQSSYHRCFITVAQGAKV